MSFATSAGSLKIKLMVNLQRNHGYAEYVGAIINTMQIHGTHWLVNFAAFTYKCLLTKSENSQYEAISKQFRV